MHRKSGWPARTDFKQYDFAPLNNHRTALTVMAGSGVFKLINAAKAHMTGVIPRKTQRPRGNRFVEKLNPFPSAGSACCLDANLPNLDAVEPEPRNKAQEDQKQEFDD